MRPDDRSSKLVEPVHPDLGVLLSEMLVGGFVFSYFGLAETWYWCKTDGFSFPASELSSHKGHVYWAIEVQN